MKTTNNGKGLAMDKNEVTRIIDAANLALATVMADDETAPEHRGDEDCDHCIIVQALNLTGHWLVKNREE